MKQNKGMQKQNIGKNRALLLKEKYDQETRSIQQKKQFVMKRFAEINPMTVPIVFLSMLFLEMAMVIKRKDTDLDWANDNSS